MKCNLVLFILLIHCCVMAKPQDKTMLSGNNIILEIKPSKTDSRITNADTPHFVTYSPTNKKGELLLFMPGTNGIALKEPKDLFYTAFQQGYAVINLSYINTPAIARVYKGDNLVKNSNCAEEFRNRRVYGDTTFSLIDDESYDAIVNRFTKPLIYLSNNDKNGNWERYLDNGIPKWKEIALVGQSHCVGMSALIAKKYLVARVIDFS